MADRNPDDLKLAEGFAAATRDDWRRAVDAVLKGADFDKALVTRTYDGLDLKPLYARDDEAAGAHPAAIAAGRQETGDGPPWQIRQLHALAEAKKINAAILDDLEGGVTAIALRIAAPGQAGLSLGSADDLERALDGVGLAMAGIWLEAGHGVANTATALQAVWKKRRLGDDSALGGFGADPLGTLARTGGHPLSLRQALDEMAGLAALTHERFPHVTAVRVDARPYHDGGGSEAQELACLCATTVAYLRAMEAAGLAPKHALAQMEFALSCDADLFAGIAKLRAARRLIARIAEASEAGAMDIHLHATTSQRMFSTLDPHVNILRATSATAAAAFGGASALTVLPFTAMSGQPDAFARRIARNVQIILQEESALGAVANPAAGSWYVEDFTQQLAQKSWELFQGIEAEGGMAEALAKGTVQAMLAKTAAARAKDVATGKLQLTGVNAFPDPGEKPSPAEAYRVADDLEDPAITVEPVPLRRPAEAYERLRARAAAWREAHGQRPKTVLVTLGPPKDHAARAGFAESVFATGGIETVSVDAPAAYDKAASPVACLCSSDGVYGAEAANAAAALRQAGAGVILLAGRPRGLENELTKAGVDRFIFAGQDNVAFLNDMHGALEIG